MGIGIFDVRARAVIDLVMIVATVETTITGPFVRHQIGLGLDVRTNLALYSFEAWESPRPQFATTLQHPEDDYPVVLATLVRIFVLVLAAQMSLLRIPGVRGLRRRRARHPIPPGLAAAADAELPEALEDDLE